MNTNTNFTLKVSSLPSNEYAFKNNLFLHTREFQGIKKMVTANGDEFYIRIREIIFGVKELSSVTQGKSILILFFRYNLNGKNV